jgi:hypothetical protein
MIQLTAHSGASEDGALMTLYFESSNKFQDFNEEEQEVIKNCQLRTMWLKNVEEK